MRVSRTLVLVTALLGTAAAAAPDMPANVPPGALNPPAYAPNKTMSVDSTSNLANDDGLSNDAKTLQGIEGGRPADPTVDRLNDARTHYIRLNNQLGADIRNHASKDTVTADREAIAAAKKQLDLDVKACDADVKATGASTSACK